MKLQMIEVSRASELAVAFDAMKRERAEALVFGPDRVFIASMTGILARAQALGLPVFAPVRVAAERGALVSYGLDARTMLLHAAAYADRLLNGARPADLPVEQPTRFELVVNVRSAKALGLKLPQSLQLRADQVMNEHSAPVLFGAWKMKLPRL
jgi:putative ABC transport system substrate-binding protein